MLSLRRLIIQNREKGESGRISPNELEDAALTERELNRAPGINLSGKNQSVQNPVDSLCPGNSRLEIGQVGPARGVSTVNRAWPGSQAICSAIESVQQGPHCCTSSSTIPRAIPHPSLNPPRNRG